MENFFGREVCLKGISSGEENSRTVMGPKYRRLHIYQKGVEIPTMQLSRLDASRLECLLQLLQSETAAVLLTETLTLFPMKMNGKSMVMETRLVKLPSSEPTVSPAVAYCT